MVTDRGLYYLLLCSQIANHSPQTNNKLPSFRIFPAAGDLCCPRGHRPRSIAEEEFYVIDAVRTSGAKKAN
jgi:hypothetical protein